MVADALSRVEEVEKPIDYQALATSQERDQELRDLRQGKSALQFMEFQLPGSNSSVTCDISTDTARPFLTPDYRRAAFNMLHRLSHPGVRATVKLVTQRFVCPSIRADCRKWAKACLDCQRSKVSRHVSAPVGSFAPTSSRFEHFPPDLVIMPPCEGQRYCFPILAVARDGAHSGPEGANSSPHFLDTWVSRFGVPLRVITDQGKQFESFLFRRLNILAGTTHIRTTAYHPAANGMVERFHRQLKAAIRCHQRRWTEALPLVLLGIRSAWKEDLSATAAEMVYGQSLRLPGEFFAPRSPGESTPDAPPFVHQLRCAFNELRPHSVQRHGEKSVFVFRDLATASHVFVRHDGVKRPLQQPYSGPYRVVRRGEKSFVVNVNGCDKTITIDRLKPAYTVAEDISASVEVLPETSDTIVVCVPGPSPVKSEGNPCAGKAPVNYRTRSGRHVRFPDRLQAGFP
jgi:cleavage and polyadenylation specificity factor subunit 1